MTDLPDDDTVVLHATAIAEIGKVIDLPNGRVQCDAWAFVNIAHDRLHDDVGFGTVAMQDFEECNCRGTFTLGDLRWAERELADLQSLHTLLGWTG